jgi:hypothetical protein
MILLMIALPLAVTYDLELGGAEAVAVAASDMGAEDGEWGAAFIQRMALSPFKLALFFGAMAALVFAALQLVATTIESRLGNSDRPGARARFVLRLSGRGGFEPIADYLDASLRFGTDTLLSPLRMGVTVFPMLGFIGTVVGLSMAIQNLPAAVADKSKLQPVLDDLYLAFDTTFLGLIGALVCIVGVRLVEAELDRHRHQRTPANVLPAPESSTT